MRISFWGDIRPIGGPAIFIDRDGVINRRKANDYVLEWSQFVFIPGIREALKQISSLGLPMILISNQSAVGRRLLPSAGLEEITVRMNDALRADGTSLTAAYFCLHRPDEHCLCRKPRPELLHRAAADFALDLPRSVFIGDSDVDIEAARLAGCQPVLFGPGVSACSKSLEWRAKLPVAHTAQELFPVTVETLQAAARAASVLPGCGD